MTTILIVTIILLFILLYWHRSLLSGERWKNHDLSRAVKRERAATTDILNQCKTTIHLGDTDDFLRKMTTFTRRTLNAHGAAAMTWRDGRLVGHSVAGVFPPMKEVTPQIEAQLHADTDKYDEFFNTVELDVSSDKGRLLFNDGFVLCRGESVDWLPEVFTRKTSSILVAPIVVRDDMMGCLLAVTSDDVDRAPFTESDGIYLQRTGELIALSLEMIGLVRERKQYEKKLRSAREEGMLEISSGIIHNIGNAVTVAKLSLADLEEKFKDPENEPGSLIVDEIVPTLERHVAEGDVGSFLSSDEIGVQYPVILRELATHSSDVFKSVANQIQGLVQKIEHISGIIELQQQFVGQLGTENMTDLGEVLENAVNIFNETFDNKGVTIDRAIDRGLPQVLIDPSMMTQVFINLIKNAIEAMEGDMESDKRRVINVALARNGDELVAEVIDNGPGIDPDILDKIFNFGFSSKKDGGHGVGLHASRETVSKYKGVIDVESKLGEGTRFSVRLPVAS